MKFQFNECAAIENMIKSKFVDTNNVTNTIYLLAKYNYHVKHLKDKENYDNIIEYITSNCRNIFEESIYNDVDASIKRIKKKTFTSIDEVCITKSELDFIHNLNDIKQEKAAFVMLAVAKFFNAFKDTNYDAAFMSHSDICKMARITIPQSDRDVFMQFAYDKGVLFRHTWSDSTIKKLTFVSHDSNDEIILRLKESDYKDLAYTYLAYLTPVRFRRCQRCGKWIRKSNKDNRLCIDCSRNEDSDKDMIKLIICMDCGKEVYADIHNKRVCRCEKCQHLKQLEYQKKSMHNLRM